jgi:iron complex transport system permease protein
VTLFFSAIVCLNLGFKYIPFSEVLSILGNQIPLVSNTVDPNSFSFGSQQIILDIRLPRILVGMVIGAALAASGVLYQGIFRNPMADPYVLGVSAGASVGAGIGMVFGSGLSLLGFPIVPITAFIAGLITIFIVYNISRVGSRVPEMSLLLTGIAITIFLAAVYQVMQIYAPNANLFHDLTAWTMGGISLASWSQLWSILPFVLAGIILSYAFTRDLNLISLGEETALHLGVNTERTKKILITLGAAMTAAAVSISGLIGFVGLMIPHITRLIMGPDHRLLLPASIIVGAIYLIICDSIARLLTGLLSGTSELPVGVITALAGGVFFVALLRRKKMNYRM